METIKKMVKVNGKNKALTIGLEIRLTEDGVFSAMGEFRFNGYDFGGQCLDDMKKVLAKNHIVCNKLNALMKYWPRYHLNDLIPGSPRQMAVVRDRKAKGLPVDYETMCNVLKHIGLYEDAEFIYNGKPYAYGNAWLKEELPAEVKKGIEAVMKMPLAVSQVKEGFKAAMKPSRTVLKIKAA